MVSTAVTLPTATKAACDHWTAADLRHWTPHRQVDLITIGYVLNELSDAARRDLIDTAAETAGTVVIVEPGTPRGHRRILEARAQLIEHGLTIAAPCPHQAGARSPRRLVPLRRTTAADRTASGR